MGGIPGATGKRSGYDCTVPVSISGSASTSRSTSATTGDDKKEAEKMSWTEMRRQSLVPKEIVHLKSAF